MQLGFVFDQNESDVSPSHILMLSQDALVHNNGNHQPSNMVHLVTSVWCFRAVVIHLGQSEPSLRSEASGNEHDSLANGDVPWDSG